MYCSYISCFITFNSTSTRYAYLHPSGTLYATWYCTRYSYLYLYSDFRSMIRVLLQTYEYSTCTLAPYQLLYHRVHYSSSTSCTMLYIQRPPDSGHHASHCTEFTGGYARCVEAWAMTTKLRTLSYAVFEFPILEN